MIRLLNFSCFAMTALACLALYHVSEETRIARVELHDDAAQDRRRAGSDEGAAGDWVRVSDPARIQQLAAEKLGVSDTPTVALASLELLPRRGDDKVLRKRAGRCAARSPIRVCKTPPCTLENRPWRRP